ncbi:hypothetical protein DVH24_020794 [Malus domestica]|uniref:Uncharacterized protein n=1 Tax=Malus domestica TaxID=3750 RepID=A0A498JEH4_MALDO|nr:hypothetical protein DVH24_020794 [Malus domestica]
MGIAEMGMARGALVFWPELVLCPRCFFMVRCLYRSFSILWRYCVWISTARRSRSCTWSPWSPPNPPTDSSSARPSLAAPSSLGSTAVAGSS